MSQEAKVAHHEAGHAVAARVQGIPVAFITTLAVDQRSAAAALTHSATYLSREAGSKIWLAAIRKDIIVCLSGPFAQQRYRPQQQKKRYPPAEWVDDFNNARNFAGTAALIASGIEVNAMEKTIPVEMTAEQIAYADLMLQQCHQAAHNLVVDHWPAIVKVAEALLSRPILNADDLDQLLGA